MHKMYELDPTVLLDDTEDFNNEWVSRTQQQRSRPNSAAIDDAVEIQEIPAPLAITAGPR